MRSTPNFKIVIYMAYLFITSWFKISVFVCRMKTHKFKVEYTRLWEKIPRENYKFKSRRSPWEFFLKIKDMFHYSFHYSLAVTTLTLSPRQYVSSFNWNQLITYRCLPEKRFKFNSKRSSELYWLSRAHSIGLEENYS